MYLAGLLMLFMATGGVALVSGWLLSQRSALAAARTDTDFAARHAAFKISENLAVVRSTVDALVVTPATRQVFTDPARCHLAFSLGGLDDGHLDVLRSDGTLVCSSRSPVDAASGAYRAASWLPGAARTAQTVGPVLDTRTGRPAVLVTAPVPGHGLIAAFIDLAGLGTTTGRHFAGPRGIEFLVTTADGETALTRSTDGLRWAGTRIADSRFSPPDASGAGVDVTGVRRVYAQANVDGTNWRVFAGVDRSATLAAARGLAQRQVLVSAVGLLAGLLVTFLVYRSITRPIARLQAAVQRADETGDHTRVGAIGGPREVRDLGAAFTELLATVDQELTERRLAEELAHEHERSYRQMFDASPYPIYLFDTTTLRIVAVNDAAVAYFGYSRGQLTAMLVTDLCPVEDTAAVVQRVASAGQVERARPLRHVKADGTVTDIEVTSHLAILAGRQVRCAVVDDVTEREKLQRRLRQSERLESLGQLAGGIAHDFNNLLGIINGYASMSANDVEELAAGDPAMRRLHADLLEIVAAGDRAAGLTRQLLAFARADAVVNPQVVDVNTVVADVEKLLRRTLGEDITLITCLAEGSHPVRADVGRLEQVLVNLAVNARDAMPSGGTLTIDTDEVTVDEHYTSQHPGVLRTGRYLRLRVSDTGTGMSRSTLEHAFEPFFTTKPTGQGTGLGLATIYGIITQAGGQAQIYSELGQGTTVVALLPVTDDPVEPRGTSATAPALGAGQQILLVEDDDSLRVLTERVLDRAGYRVLAAATAAEARELAAANHVDLLLSDVVMPDMHGPDLALALRADLPSLRVIFMSGYAETILAARSTLPPGAILLNKPVSSDQLLATIDRVINKDRVVAP
ncbi:MAG TPA: ATP-binding protein [Actinoplanes sp.]|nr:ATP-binding protein [Actinoplanes sp.]